MIPEKIVTIGIIVMCVAMLFFVWAAVKAIRQTVNEKAEELSKKQMKQRPKDTRLVCGFMRYEIWKPWIARFKPFDHEMVTTPFGVYSFYEFEEKLRSDWGWLHEISNKIGKIPFSEVDGMREWMAIEWSDSNVNIHSTKKEVYDAIIKFIVWYNDNK